MHHHVEEVDLAFGRLAVQTQIPAGTGQAIVLAQVAVELRKHVGRIGRIRHQVLPGDRIAQRGRIQRIGLGTGEVVDDPVRPGLAQRAAGGGTGQPRERGIHLDLDVALQHRAPQVHGVLVCDAALLADRAARVAAQRCGSGRVVQTDHGAGIAIDQRDIGGPCMQRCQGGRHGQGQQQQGLIHAAALHARRGWVGWCRPRRCVR